MVSDNAAFVSICSRDALSDVRTGYDCDMAPFLILHPSDHLCLEEQCC